MKNQIYFTLIPSLLLTLVQAKTPHTFEKYHLDNYYWSEGACFVDLNRDGIEDAISGPYWWEGPELTTRREIYPDATTFTTEFPDGSKKILPGFVGVLGNTNGYSTDSFFAFGYDFNQDGWNDILTFGLPHTPAYVFLNPQEEERHWERFQVFDEVDNESPTFADLTGDGLPEIVCNYKGNFGYASPDWNDPLKPWPFTAISENGEWPRYTHGMGIGDVNSDEHTDILYSQGWWEQPEGAKSGSIWGQHLVAFAPHGGNQ